MCKPFDVVVASAAVLGLTGDAPGGNVVPVVVGIVPVVVVPTGNDVVGGTVVIVGSVDGGGEVTAQGKNIFTECSN